MNKKDSNKVLKILSGKMRQAREDKGISKREFSKASGLDRSTIRLIEDPEKNPTVLSLIKAANALGTDLSKIFADSFEEASGED